MMTPVLDSILADFFEDHPASTELAEVFFLASDEAQSAWSSVFGNTARNFHDLPKGSWIDGSWSQVGTWIDAYNDQSPADQVFNCVKNASGWSIDRDLWLFQGRQRVLKFPFKSFENSWKSMLAAFDDSPVLMDIHDLSGPVFSFVPLGGVLQKDAPLRPPVDGAVLRRH